MPDNKKRKSKQIAPQLPLANSAATPPGPWRPVEWAVVSPSASGSAPPPQRRRKGPKPGTVDRYGEADRALYHEMKRLIPEYGSVEGAALELARDKKVAGLGTSTPESRARRLARRYRKEADGG
jgi:hypothetical protein